MTNCGFSLPVVSLCAIFPFIPQVWNILRHFSFLPFLVGTELKKAVFPAGRMYFGRLRDPPHFGSSAAASKLSSSYSVLCFCLRSQVAVLSITSLASLILLAGFYNSHWFGNEIIPVDQFVVSVDSQVLVLLHHIHFLPQHRHHSFSHPLSFEAGDSSLTTPKSHPFCTPPAHHVYIHPLQTLYIISVGHMTCSYGDSKVLCEALVNQREYRGFPCGSQSSSRQHQHKAAGLVKLSSCLLTGPKITAKHVGDLMHRGYLVGRQNH